MRIILGAGGTTQDGWIATEQRELDVRSPGDFEEFLGDSKVDAFIAEHLFEHLTPDETRVALANILDYLAPLGTLRIAVPDGYHADQNYIDWVRPGGVGPGCDSHHQLFNCDTLTTFLSEAGYEYILVEWWDEDGKFYSIYTHGTEASKGRVSRCYLNDERNADGQVRYTSLIVDAWRKQDGRSGKDA